MKLSSNQDSRGKGTISHEKWKLRDVDPNLLQKIIIYIKSSGRKIKQLVIDREENIKRLQLGLTENSQRTENETTSTEMTSQYKL